METLIFADDVLIRGKDKGNWRETKSMEPHYKGIHTENEYGQDSDYGDFKEPKHKWQNKH
jgi:hypothetical protein